MTRIRADQLRSMISTRAVSMCMPTRAASLRVLTSCIHHHRTAAWRSANAMPAPQLYLCHTSRTTRTSMVCSQPFFRMQFFLRYITCTSKDLIYMNPRQRPSRTLACCVLSQRHLVCAVAHLKVTRCHFDRVVNCVAPAIWNNARLLCLGFVPAWCRRLLGMPSPRESSDSLRHRDLNFDFGLEAWIFFYVLLQIGCSPSAQIT